MLAREVLRAAHLADRLDSLRPDAGLLHGALPIARRGAAGSDKGCRALALGRAVTSRRGHQRPATGRYAHRGSETSTTRREKPPTAAVVARLAHIDLGGMEDRRFGDPPFLLARGVSKHTPSMRKSPIWGTKKSPMWCRRSDPAR